MTTASDPIAWDKKTGLIPAIVQDHATKQVLMLAWMDKAALDATIATGKAHFYSRSRQRMWMKGESSGHIQQVKEIFTDCDTDTLLLVVEQIGGIACHTGRASCFYQQLTPTGWVTAAPVLKDPAKIYSS